MNSLRRSLLIIFGIALLLRLFVFVYVVHEPRKFYTYDSDGYDRRALNLLSYGVFSSSEQPPFKPDLDRTPTYPVFLAAIFGVVGHIPAAAALVQILIGSLTVLLAYRVARDLKLSTTAALLAAGIVAIEPISAITTNRLLTETLFTFLAMASVWTVVRYWQTELARWLIAAAVLVALTSLTRPINQFLPIALLPLFVLAAKHGRRRRMFAAGVVFTLLSLALTYTWAYRNYLQTGLFTLSTISDTNLIYYRARAVLAEVENTSQDKAWQRLQAEIEQTAQAQNLTQAQKIDLQRERAIQIFKDHPLLTVTMTGKGLVRMMADPGYTIVCTMLDRTTTAFDCFPGKSSMNEPGLFGKAFGKFAQMTIVQQVALIWSALLLGVLYLGAAIGAIRLFRERQWLTLGLMLIMIGYYVGLSAGAEANSRFRIPAIPYLAILAGVGLAWLLQWSRARSAQRQSVTRPAEQPSV